MMLSQEVQGLVQRLDMAAALISRRDTRYRGSGVLRFAADEIKGDLARFNVNYYRLAVDAVAERMRVKGFTATARGNDVSDRANAAWTRSHMDQLLQPFIVDVLALGSAYLIVWPDQRGNVTLTPESSRNVAAERHPITGEVTGAVKRWYVTDASGAIQSEHIVHYGLDKITSYTREGAGDWSVRAVVDNSLGVVPVVPVVNFARVGDQHGHSVIDDLADPVDGLSKTIADMLVASEDVARPRRWATGVDLEEQDDGFSADGDGFTADAETETQATPTPEAVSPFESGNRMFTVESPDAKFGQLPGADLKGYQTAVDILVQQIMSVSALPAHMMGISTSNPASADAIRSAEAGITARAASRIRVIGISIEQAIALAMSIETGAPVDDVEAVIQWANPATRSVAAEADAAVKLHAEGIYSTEEARAVVDAAGVN